MFQVTFEDIAHAYFKCRKSKRNTKAALNFELNNWQAQCFKLRDELNNRTYEIGKSTCFIIDKPVKREIFAAAFRDRIVQCYVAENLRSSFDDYLYPCMMSNRIGKGTSGAQNEMYDILTNRCSGQDTIYKFDIKAFFMSIDKRILWNDLEKFLNTSYNVPNKDLILYLTKKMIFHCPQKNCTYRCAKSKWDDLPDDKSLFKQDEFHGLRIGDWTSQMFALFYLRPLIEWLYSQSHVKYIVQYVDDICLISSDKEQLLKMIPELRIFLKERLGLTLHPRKSYIQHYSKGVSFVGQKMKPNRRFLGSRSLSHALCTAKLYSDISNEPNLYKMCNVVNSYLGMMRNTNNIKDEEFIANTLFTRKHPNTKHHMFYFKIKNSHYTCVINKTYIRKEFKKRKYRLKQERKSFYFKHIHYLPPKYKIKRARI